MAGETTTTTTGRPSNAAGLNTGGGLNPQLQGYAQKYGGAGGTLGSGAMQPGSWTYERAGSMQYKLPGIGGGMRTAQGWKQVSIDDQMAKLYTMTPAQLKAMQEKLYAGGFYPPTMSKESINWGVPDEDTLQAWETAVRRAANFARAGVHKTVDDVLRDAAKNGPRTKADETKAFQAELSDEDDLRAIFKASSQALLGRYASDAEIDAMVSGYRAQQMATQQQNYNMGTANQAGQLATLEEPGVYAENQLRAQRPVDTGAYDVAKQYQEFLSLLGGGD